MVPRKEPCVYVRRAEASMARGAYRSAVRAASRASQRDPMCCDALVTRAAAYTALGESALAAADTARAARINTLRPCDGARSAAILTEPDPMDAKPAGLADAQDQVSLATERHELHAPLATEAEELRRKAAAAAVREEALRVALRQQATDAVTRALYRRDTAAERDGLLQETQASLARALAAAEAAAVREEDLRQALCEARAEVDVLTYAVGAAQDAARPELEAVHEELEALRQEVAARELAITEGAMREASLRAELEEKSARYDFLRSS